MRKVFPSQYFFAKEIEEEYIEWIFGKTKIFVVAVGIMIFLCLTCITIADIYTIGLDGVLSSVLYTRVILLGTTLLIIIAFLSLSAKHAHCALLISNFIIAIVATIDTYYWVGQIGYFNPANQIITIFFFMIVPFLNVEHKVLTGLIVIIGIIFCGIALQVQLYWTLIYVLIVYLSAIVVYYKFDVLLRIQFKTICNEKSKANIDALTGVYNRNAMHTFILEDILKISDDKVIILGILDIDCFKLYNDTYGHLAGDRVLKQFAQSLLSLGFDRVYRFGGEEFVFTWIVDDRDTVVFPDICEVLENHKIVHKTSIASDFVTASIGIVKISYDVLRDNNIDKAYVDKLIKYADENMYKAKKMGRNRIVITEKKVL